MMQYPEVPPIPPGWKMPPYFSTTPLWPTYAKALASKGRTSIEIAAINLAERAILFLVGFEPPPGSDYLLADRTTSAKDRIFFWINRTKPWLDYLDAYLAEVRREGTPEQTKFLSDILDRPALEDEVQSCPVTDDEDDSDDVDKVESYPEPSEAILILERIAQEHPTTSVECVAFQMAIRALRYLIESGEAPEFMRYVEQMSKWEPSVE